MVFSGWGRAALRSQLAAVLAVACIALVAAGCGEEESGSSGSSGGSTTSSDGGKPVVEAKTIGYMTIFNDPVQQRFFKVFEGAAKFVGWDVKFQDAKGDPGAAVKILNNFLQQDVDGIVAACTETPVIRQALEDAQESDIPVIAVACPVSPPEDAWTAINAEDEAGLATALAEHVASDLEAEGGGSVGMLYDTTFLSGKIRHDIFVEKLEEVGVEIAAEQTVALDDPTGNARRAASGIITAHPDVSSIIAIYDWMAPPTISAIETAGKENDISVYSFYADHVNLPLLLDPDGPMKAVVDGPVENVSAVAVDQLLAYFSGQEVDREAASELETDFTIYTKETAKELNFDEETYLGPVDLDSVLAPWEKKWSEAYQLG